MSFVHLHVHSEYSLLDGFSNIKKLVNRAKELGMPALALTDHGTMFGAIDFYNAATAADIKPIIGVESYMAARTMRDRDSQLDKRSSHLLLLAENETGYRNLLKIASAAQLEGFYYFPRVDHPFLAEHAEGLICTSGCLSAEIPRAIRNGQLEDARRKLDWYYEVFGADRFFLELQDHDVPQLNEVNRTLLELGDRYQARFIATNDVHYVDKGDHRLQDILLAIQTSCVLSDPKRMRMSDNSYYLRPPDEMADLFKEVPGAIDNTLLIAERCELDLGFKGYRLPHFPVPDGYTAESLLREKCEQGLKRRYGPHANDPEVRERLEYELKIIHEMGFDTYFLIVWDLCIYAQQEGIWYNARGSAAGSIVAYTLGITMVDPLEHGLIFERFLNPGRISMPDIDLDFRDDMRYRMLEYSSQKYGEDKVAQVITFGTLKARAAVRDVGRVLDIPLPEVDRIAKYIPNIPGKPVSIQEAIEKVPDFRQAYQTHEYLRELIDTAKEMEGVVRNAGTHAAGVIITDKPIVDYVPLHRPTGSAAEDNPIKTVTQFEMEVLDSLGLLKVDFLGLATLTIMAKACKLIEKRHGVRHNLYNIPTDDPATFELLGRGETAGVFQVEGTGMRRNLVQMKPKSLDNVVAMVALFRPGPMDFIPKYIRRMHGEEEIEYHHPSLEPIFKETFGIAVYQEQIMRAAVEIAGYTAPEADDLRKAIAKKIKTKLLKHRKKFISGAGDNDISNKTAEIIFDDWVEFARYGFNKCLPGDVEVLDPSTGRLLRIEDIYQGKETLAETISLDTETLTLTRKQVIEVVDNGQKPVYRLTTALGRTIEATLNHPFFSRNGWQILDHLQMGDFIGVPQKLPVEGTIEWPNHKIIALAQLLGEGNIKEFPTRVFELTNKQLGLLISRMWESEGHINHADENLSYATPSERFARQLQHLLLRFGLVSRLDKVEISSQEGLPGYQISITGLSNFTRFARHIGVHFISTRNKEKIATMEFSPALSTNLAGFETETVQRLATDLDDESFQNNPDGDIYWDRVLQIEYVGIKQTYDLEIAQVHNFVANDIVVHNSHAVDYGVIAVQTAYLKVHYPVEYMTALLTVSKNDSDKVAAYAADCRRMGIEVLQPDVNTSDWDFVIQDCPDGKTGIRFGMGAIKNVGQGSVEEILKANQEAPFEDLNDFARRVDLRTVGKRSLECLIKVGALDSFGPRAALLQAMDQIHGISASHHRAKETGQLSLFGPQTGLIENIILPKPGYEIPKREQLNWERELIGLYVSDHPLNPYLKDLEKAVTHFSNQLSDAENRERVRVAGMITQVRPHQTKTGKAMGFARLEDLQGVIDLVIFPHTWNKFASLFTYDKVILIDGKVDNEGGDSKILVDHVSNEFQVTMAADTNPPSTPPTHELPRSPAVDQNVQSMPIAPTGSTHPSEQEKGQEGRGPKISESAEIPPPPEPFPAEWEASYEPAYAISSSSSPQPISESQGHEVIEKEDVEEAVPEEAISDSENVEVISESAQTSAPPLSTPSSPSVEDARKDPTPSPAPAVTLDLSDKIDPSLKLDAIPDGEKPRQMLTVILRASGDKTRDILHLRRIHGTMVSYPGYDRFAFYMVEAGRSYALEFPNYTTGVCDELLAHLRGLLGTENVTVEEITYQ